MLVEHAAQIKIFQLIAKKMDQQYNQARFLKETQMKWTDKPN